MVRVEEDTTATAVSGAGNIGKTLTGLLSKAGEPLAIAASRLPN